MNEIGKTLSLAIAAIFLVGVTFLTRSRLDALGETDFVVGKIYEKFDDPLSVATFEITDFDEDQATIKPFKAAIVDGLWAIPSHQNYPADANRQLAVATASLIGVEKLERVSTLKSDHEVFGVIDPTDTKNLSVGVKGVGKHVRLSDSGGNKLLELIVGKEDPKQPGLRFVRVPGRDEVYASRIDVSKLTTKFHEWIETDLLKLNAFDVQRLTVKDYSVDELRGTLNYRGEYKVRFDSKESKWNLEELKEAGQQGLQVVALAADQELDTAKLNDLKTALDDLKIVDVERKPEGLAADLAVSDDLKADRGKLQSLMQRGFFPAQVTGPDGSKKIELVSNEGEVVCAMNDGVEYILRFGQIASGKSSDDDDKKDGDKQPGETKEGGVDRFIMVSARFNPDLIAKPELKPEPGQAPPASATPVIKSESPSTPKPTEKKPEENKPAENKPAENKPAENKPAENKPGPAPSAPAKTDAPNSSPSKSTPPSGDTKSSETKAGGSGAFNVFDDPTKDAKPADEKSPPKSDPKPAAPAAETKASDSKPAAASATNPTASDPAAADAAKQRQEAELKAIRDENKRLQDEYEKKLADGKKRVDELNRRFATWYYIIGDSVYRKIHVTTKDVLKKKEAAAGAPTPGKDDPISKFNDLKDKGLDK